MLNLLLLLNVILIICAAVFIVKELLVKFNFSRNGFKNFIVIFCSVISLIIAGAGLFQVINIQQGISYAQLSINKSNPNATHDGVPER